MKKMSVCILISLFAFIFTFTGMCLSSISSYNGFTISFNAETNDGLVYKNNSASSALFVSYPSKDETYLYSKEGQAVISTKEFLTKMKSSVAMSSIVAFINPVQ